jgi:hypothetical protein
VACLSKALLMDSRPMKKPHPQPIDPTVSALAALLGQRGGRSRSTKKLAAVRLNQQKAAAARRKKATPRVIKSPPLAFTVSASKAV